jgi:hypothetical protein
MEFWIGLGIGFVLGAVSAIGGLVFYGRKQIRDALSQLKVKVEDVEEKPINRMRK